MATLLFYRCKVLLPVIWVIYFVITGCKSSGGTDQESDTGTSMSQLGFDRVEHINANNQEAYLLSGYCVGNGVEIRYLIGDQWEFEIEGNPDQNDEVGEAEEESGDETDMSDEQLANKQTEEGEEGDSEQGTGDTQQVGGCAEYSNT